MRLFTADSNRVSCHTQWIVAVLSLEVEVSVPWPVVGSLDPKVSVALSVALDIQASDAALLVCIEVTLRKRVFCSVILSRNFIEVDRNRFVFTKCLVVAPNQE